MTLPAQRIIETASFGEMWEPDVTEEEAAEILEAITFGRLLFWVCTQGPEKHTANHREVDLTHYRDPRSGELRYAVETWLAGRKWTTDFSTKTAADDQVAIDRRMVSL